MPDIFEGIYYDGKTPQPYKAQVQLEPSALHITYFAQNNTLPVNVYWQVHRLQNKIIAATGQTQLQYGANPTQLLEIPNPEFLRKLEDYYAPKAASASAKDLTANKTPVWFGQFYFCFWP